MSARDRIQAMFQLDADTARELDLRLDAHRIESLDEGIDALDKWAHRPGLPFAIGVLKSVRDDLEPERRGSEPGVSSPAARSVIELALTRYFRRDADAKGAAVQLLAKYDAGRRAEDGQAYDGELAMLRGLVATLHAVAEHGDLPDVRKLLAEHKRDEQDAREEAPRG